MVRTPRRRARLNRSLGILGAAVAASLSSSAWAASGTWTNAAGGNWNLAETGNWSGGTVADGIDGTADFNTLDITADTTVILTESRTIGNLIFGDTTTGTAGSWILNANAAATNLTLDVTAGTPTITVNTLGTGEQATLSMVIAGTLGFIKAGNGILALTSTGNLYTGDTTVNAGTLSGTTATIRGNLANNSAVTFDQGTLGTFAGNISGTGSLTKAGVGTVVLTGAGSTYTGTTTVNRGTLAWANAGSLSTLGSGSVLVNPTGGVNYAPGITDATFLSKINTSSTGALALGSGDAATNLDFTAGVLAPLSGMTVGAVATTTVTYSGTITPAANTYRLGGGGGTLLVNSAIAGAGNALVVGNVGATGANGTVILNNSANTYDGTTTVNANHTLQVGNGGTFASFSAADVTTNGTFIINRTGNYTFTNNVGGTGILAFNAGSVTSTGTINMAGSLQLHTAAGPTGQPRFTLNGASVTADALSILNSPTGSTSSAYTQLSGTSTFNGGFQVGSGNDNSVLQVLGGTFSASTLTIRRSSNFGAGANPSATTGTTTTGIYIAGGTVNVTNDVNIGFGNAGTNTRLDGGVITVGGNFILGNQTATNRWNLLDVNGATLNVNGPLGIIIAADTATEHLERSWFTHRAGTTTATGLSFGDVPTLIDGQGIFNLTGGTVYLGTGGMIKRGTGAFVASARLQGGTLAATADFVSDVDNVLLGNITIQAADSGAVARNITFNGALNGSGTFTKTGAGSLTLSGATAAYTGNPTVSAGTLIGNSTTLRNNIANAGAIEFNQASAGTYSGLISGSGSLTKSNSGTLVLSSPQTYTGATSVTGGSLRVSGTLGAVTIGNGAGLAVNSGNLTTSSLTLGSSTTLGVNDGSGLRTITAPALSTAGTTIDVGITGFSLGTTTLIDYTGAIAGSGFGGFTLGTLPSRVTASLVNNVGNTSVDLNVTLIDFPRWEGTDGTNPSFWDINTTVNWKEATSNTATTYLQNTIPGDQVLFTDAAAGTTTVDVTTTVQPSFVSVNNDTKNYTFTGSGKISGVGSLSKQGTGSLTISNTGGNDYSGNTTISGGSVVLGADNVLSDNSQVIINGGTLDINTRSDVTGNVTLTSGTITGTSGILSGANYDVRSGTINASISGAGAFIKTTGGSVALNTAATYGGPTTVAEGTLTLGVNDALPIATNLTIGTLSTGGTLEMNGFSQQVDRVSTNGTSANTIVNSAGGPATVFKILGAGNTTYNGALNGNLALHMNGTASLTLGGTTSTYTGGTTIDNLGILGIQDDSSLGAVPGISSNNVNFTLAGGTLRSNASATNINLAATRDIFIDFGTTASFDTNGGANTMTINGVINGGGHLGKLGNGTLILTNANTYGGSTTLVAGNLRASNNSAFGATTITITGATASLQLDNNIVLTNNVVSNSNTNHMIDVPIAGASATFAGNFSANPGFQYRVATTGGGGATLTLTGAATLTNTLVAQAGNVILTGTSSITGTGGGANALIGRTENAITTLALTLQDSTSINMGGSTILGNQRNMTDVSVTLNGTSSYTTLGNFNINDTSNATGTSVVSLNGTSILTAGSFTKTGGAAQVSALNFNGGSLIVAGTSNTYMPAMAGLSVNVNSDATVNTNGFDAIINQPFVAAGPGGLVKNGLGNLTMGGASTYTGATVANDGKLTFANSLTTSSSLSVNNAAIVEIAPTGLGTRVIRTGAISVAPAAKINVQDNKIITTTAAGTWNGTNYTNVTGLIASGKGTGNNWDGSTGIITSKSDAIGSNFTSVGVSTGAEVLVSRGLSVTQTMLWAGQVIAAADTLVMYTYGGDANLDGKLNVDDYIAIDQGIAAGLKGWSNGDFNYDGVINIDDYSTVIDSNIGNQLLGTFSTAGGLVGGELSGVSAVPEPAGLAFLATALGAATLRRRRRQA